MNKCKYDGMFADKDGNHENCKKNSNALSTKELKAICEQKVDEDVCVYDKISRRTILLLPKEEYARVYSDIKTRYGNRVPKRGCVFNRNHFYVFNKSIDDRITFSGRIEIVGNEEYIEEASKIYD